MPKLPSRWKNCPRFGEVVADIFLPFKTPLDERYISQLSPSCYFTPSMILSFIKQSQINIGLWIDLTYTERFYSKEVIEQEKISYVKLRCRGHGECPSPDQTNIFIKLCSQFLEQNPGKLIAVHCTHGFNRTGFLISAFLVEQENWSIEAAISSFRRARPPGIYKQDYINELFKLFGQEDDEIITAPTLPDWCNEDEEDDDDVQNYSGPSSSSNNNSDNQRLENIDKTILITDQHKIRSLQSVCSSLCHFNPKKFPGCQPVSMTRENMNLIIKEEYLVSWKADGNRYMMLILNESEMYFFDRDYRVYQIFDLTFLKRNGKEPLEITLLDGELVNDVVEGKTYPRYLIYDIIHCEGEDVSSKNFRERLNIIFKNVIHPRDVAKRNGTIYRDCEPIGVRIKDFCELKDCYKYFSDKFRRSLSHEIDGLIFQPVNLPYLGGRCDKVLKWKPPSHNSIDFRLRIIEETRPGRIEKYIGQLLVLGQNEPFAYIKVTTNLKKYNGKIIECTFNSQINSWEFMRERTDKSYPNALSTANSVFFSIQYPIHIEYLLDFIKKSSIR